MSQESLEFRKSILAFLNQPNSKKKRTLLVQAARNIHSKTRNDYPNECTEAFLTLLYSSIQSSLIDIKVSPETYEQFEFFLDDLSCSQNEDDRLCGYVLEPAFIFLHPFKTSLKEIYLKFQDFQKKLENEQKFISQKKLYSSFFISDLDEQNIHNKKSVIDDLLSVIIETLRDEDASISIENKIDYAKINEIQLILTKLVDRINQVLGDTQNEIPEIRQALMTHSFNDSYIFIFLAKLVKTIKELLGFKTSVESYLENIVIEVKKTAYPH